MGLQVLESLSAVGMRASLPLAGFVPAVGLFAGRESGMVRHQALAPLGVRSGEGAVAKLLVIATVAVLHIRRGATGPELRGWRHSRGARVRLAGMLKTTLVGVDGYRLTDFGMD